ncbi:PREDICTED: uncharacterized protein LOC104729854 [Camelina sativa]|uniref:Uncharacterized protein LOC104729854 n=1 Tax=Camelina sativa TaxID=90675 RepID=A0ABM0UW13_CAMSA|nr:PREDICTED: uncharacterized protein LOC104729854 [Camelina sativa]
MMRNMFAKKYSGRWTHCRDFTTSLSSSSTSSIFERVWDKQSTDFVDRTARREKLNIMMEEHEKYFDAVLDRCYSPRLVDPKLYPSQNNHARAASKTNSQATMPAPQDELRQP